MQTTARCCRRAPSRRRACSPSNAQAMSVSRERARAEQRVDGDDRGRRRWPRCRRDRSTAADPCGWSAPRPAARRAASAAPSAAMPAVFFAASRGRRPPSPTMSSMRHQRRPSMNRAVTSSPGDSSAKPSTSNPHATFDTVAGAKAVTAVHGEILRRSSKEGLCGGRACSISSRCSF